MELNFAYRIYIDETHLEKALRYLHAHCDSEYTDFEFQGDVMFHIDKASVGTVKTKIEIYQPESLSCSLVVEKDDSIVNYYINNLAQIYNPEIDSEKRSLRYWQTDKNHFRLTDIELYILDYSEFLENTLELSFFALNPNLSLLFSESKSIKKFFTRFCEIVEAKHAFLQQEEYGIQMLYLDGEKCDYSIPVFAESFDKYGVIPVIKDILKDKL
ncbi:MAG: hypothetical protein E6772_14300 [Dysgonomonas sp.]|nr:hypothetical protein [Dysgonomonas sp.]